MPQTSPTRTPTKPNHSLMEATLTTVPTEATLTTVPMEVSLTREDSITLTLKPKALSEGKRPSASELFLMYFR